MSAVDVRDLLTAAGAAKTAAGEEARPAPIGPAASPAATAPEQRRSPLSPVVLSGVVRALDFVLIIALAMGARQVEAHEVNLLDLVCATLISGLAIGLFQAGGAYQMAAFKNLAASAVKVLVGWSLTVLAVAGVMALTRLADHGWPIWLASLYVFGLGALLSDRAGLHAFVRAKARQGAFDRRIAIVGGGGAAEDLIHALEASNDGSIKIIGVFDDRNVDRSSDGVATDRVARPPKLGNVSDLVSYARRSTVDLIVFTVPISAETRILQMLAKLWVLPIDIRLSAHSAKLRLRPRAYSYVGAVPVLDVYDKPLSDWAVIAKGAFDGIIALAALVCLAPVMLIVALAVKLGSRGPVLFKQKRYGFNNELIEVFKFRSMYVDQGDAAAAKLVSKDDPRVTPIGRFIRKTSLDELPQLFNVLRGDLSLVGPRPHALQAKAANTLYDQVVDGYFARHKVKPGITGWAQINGWRGETDTTEKIERRVEYDLYYIENWSILFDLKILARTPFALLNTQNAY